ncbi:MAG: hypothetical protein PQJ59_06070 [Spirochaetales bacterium]|nr:hypothetical protein [Spirochaetales bacterium]
MLYAKTAAPPEIAPLYIGTYDINIVVNHWPDNIEQNGGVIEIWNGDFSIKLSDIIVYRTEYKEELEKDVQDVFICSIEYDSSTNILRVENELGRVYFIDLATIASA